MTVEKPFPSVFISYSSSDKEFVRRLADNFRKANVTVWIDEAEIKAGDSLLQKIPQAIHEVDYFAIVVSSHSVKSDWVQKELNIALTRELETKGIKVIPLLIERVGLPYSLIDKRYVDFTSEEKFNESFPRLLKDMGIEVSPNTLQTIRENVLEVVRIYEEPTTQLKIEDSGYRSFNASRIDQATGIEIQVSSPPGNPSDFNYNSATDTWTAKN